MVMTASSVRRLFHIGIAMPCWFGNKQEIFLTNGIAYVIPPEETVDVYWYQFKDNIYIL